MEKKVRISDIAQHTGFSIATVSRVINNKGYVNQQTRQAVEDAVKALGYNKDINAPRKFANMSNAVLIMAAQNSDMSSMVISAATARLEAQGKMVFTCKNNFDVNKKIDYLRYANRNGFAGVIVFDTLETPETIKAIEALSCPLVLIHPPYRSLSADAVCMDNARGAYLIVQHLIEQGHTKIGMLAGMQITRTTQNREKGYRFALEDAGIPVCEEYIHYGAFDEASAYEYVEKVYRAHPEITAVFCCSGIAAVGLVQAFSHAGCKVPEDVSVASFLHAETENFSKMKLTTVVFDYQLVGTSVADALLNRIEHPFSPQRVITFSPTIICGESVAPPRDT